MFRTSIALSLLFVAAIIATACGGGGADTGTSPSAVTTPTTTTTTTTTSTTTALAYVNDIKPILDADCTVCHGSRIHENNVRLDTYANVMRVVTAGSANSLLVRETRPGAQMYVNFSGDRAAKSELIRAWVVNNGAVETR